MPTRRKNAADKVVDEPPLTSDEVTVEDLTPQCKSVSKPEEQYAAACLRYDMKVDPSVAIWLRFGGDVLQISDLVPFEGCLLPMYDFLVSNKALRHLSLHVPSAYHAKGTGNSNARVLRHVLAKTHSLEVLDLQCAGIDHAGLVELCDGLKENTTLKELNLRWNYLGPEGGKLLADLLLKPGGTTLRRLDVSFSSIGCFEVRRLVSITGRRAVDSRVPGVESASGLVVEVAGNFVTEELWNAVTHGAAFVLSIVGSCIILYKVSGAPVHHIWGCVLFSLSLLFMFLASTLYHSLFLYPLATRIFQMLDHAGIFVLIAGTYSPFLLFYCTEAHLNLLKFQWVLCGLGVLVHLLSQYADWGTSRAYLSAELSLYIVMGWSIIWVWDSLTSMLPSSSFTMLVSGGIMYSAGIPFFILGEYFPICHTVWHVFVTTAAICHWFSVRDAMYDAMEHHSQGPFIPEIAWYNERFDQIKGKVGQFKGKVGQLFHIYDDHSFADSLRALQSRLDSQALLLSGLAAWRNVSLLERLVPGWGSNSTQLLMDLGR